MTDLISQFFASEDNDSIFTLSEVSAAALNQGVDITLMYCLHTGKPIGKVFDSEIQYALDEEMSEDIDDVVDSMIVRTVASMRPSPALNRPDSQTLSILSRKAPVDCIAYLVNRLHGSRDLLTKRNSESSFSPLLSRIETYRRWSDMAAKGVDLTPWMHWLLEIDAKLNLHDLRAPVVSKDRLNKLFLTSHGQRLLDMVTPESASTLYPLFERWVFQQIGVYDSNVKLSTQTDNWSRGNRMAVTAYTRSWLENPVVARRASDAKRKHEDVLQIIQGKKALKFGKTPKPATPKQIKQATAMALLETLESGLALPIKINAPAPAPATVTPKPVVALGGLKLNLLRKA